MRNAIWLLFVVSVAMSSLILAGCDSSSPKAAVTLPLQSLPDQPPVDRIEVLGQQFEKPDRLRSSTGDFVSVESPGYACPTLADINGDGSLDLIVGQFAGGRMKVYLGNNSSVSSADFGDADWVRSSDKPAQVPGVS